MNIYMYNARYESSLSANLLVEFELVCEKNIADSVSYTILRDIEIVKEIYVPLLATTLIFM